MRDVKVKWRKTTAFPAERRSGRVLSVELNLPTGLETLNADEARAVDAISEGGEGLLDPEMGRGFGLAIGYHVSNEPNPLSKRTLGVAYHLRGAFDATTRVERSDRDTLDLTYSYERKQTQNKRMRAAFGLALHTAEDYAVDGVHQIEAQSYMDFITQYSLFRRHSARRSSTIQLAYTFRGVRDYFDASGNVTRNVDLGDRLNLYWVFHQHMSGQYKYNYGIHYVRTGESKDEATGATVLNSKRNEAYLVFGNGPGWGFTKGWKKGSRSFRANVSFGLTNDASSVKASVGWVWDF